jgi:hypothetical protein
MNNSVRNILIDKINFGFIIYKDYKSNQTSFFTDPKLPLQFAYMTFNKDENIMPHEHNVFTREVSNTNEVLIVKSGSIRVNFFNKKVKVHHEIINKGDIIFLQDGGHSFDFLEDSEIFEVKNGPYFGEKKDKIKF